MSQFGELQNVILFAVTAQFGLFIALAIACLIGFWMCSVIWALIGGRGK